MKQKRFVICIVLVIVLTMCFVACSEESSSSDKSSGGSISGGLSEELVSQRSQLLHIGETCQLSLPDEAVTVSSSDEKVVTVNDSGLVTAVGKGTAFVTVSKDDEVAYCGFLVDPAGSMIDVTKLSANEVFSDMELHSGTEITGMAVDAKNEIIYFAQGYGSSAYNPLNSETIINKVEKKEGAWVLTDWMRYSGSGKGSICVDNDGQTARLWMECNGDYMGYGRAISLVDWSDNSYGLAPFGQVFTPQGVVGSMTVTADPENNMVLVYDRGEKCYRLYDRTQMLAGEEAPEYVHSFTCKANQTPVAGEDDSQGRYNASIRGYALYDGYVYQFSGSSSIYLSVFDLEGNLQYCHRLEGMPEVDYYIPASVAISDGKLYVVIASGESAYNFANVLVFE